MALGSIRTFFNEAVREGLAVVRQAAKLVADFIAPPVASPASGGTMTVNLNSEYLRQMQRSPYLRSDGDTGIKQQTSQGAARRTTPDHLTRGS